MDHTTTEAWAQETADRTILGTGVGTSEQETSLPEDMPPRMQPHDSIRWLGKKFIETILAGKLIKGDMSTVEGHGLDAKLNNMIADLPYVALVENLREADEPWFLTQPTQTRDPKDVFPYLVGRAFCGGPTTLRRSIRELIAPGSTPTNTDPARGHSNSSSGESNRSSNGGRSRGSTPPTPDSIKDSLPRFTMALHERCTRDHQASPVYSTERLSLDPPLFVATVTVGGTRFRGGEQPKKKLAEHEASREACRSLGIPPV